MFKKIFIIVVTVLVIIPMFVSCTPGVQTSPPVATDNPTTKPQLPPVVENKTTPANPAILEQENIKTLDATDTQGIMKCSGQKVRVKGTVVEFTSIYDDNKKPILICFTNKGSHLNSQDAWQQNQAGSDFKAFIYKEYFPQFPALDEYYDNEVIVEGTVDTFKGGPVIVLKDASQVQYVNKQPINMAVPDNLKNTKIAFVSDRDGNPDPYFYGGDGRGEIYVMDGDGGNTIKLTNSGSSNRAPAWSPDGKKIAFMSNRSGIGFWDIYVMNADGSDVTQLTENHGDNFGPSWLPDGTEIVYASTYTGDNSINLFIMNADGTGRKRITNMPRTTSIFSPKYSQDGKRIFCMSNDGGSIAITELDLATGNRTNLTQGNIKGTGFPNVSPD